MVIQAINNFVLKLEGILAKTDTSGTTSFIKQGAILNPDDILILINNLVALHQIILDT